MNKKCPLCKGDYDKVIYYGLPVKFCKNETCNCVFGFWTFITDHLPFNGVLFKYKTFYLYALFLWLIGEYDADSVG